MFDVHFVISLTLLANSSMVTSFVLPTFTTSPFAFGFIVNSINPVTLSVI